MQVEMAEATTEVITPPRIGERWPGQGGIYVGILPALGDRPEMHMVASEEETELKWGPYGTDVAGAASRHDGRANTAAIVAAQGEHPAAAWCNKFEADGLGDFHLPSQAELFLASLYAPQVFSKSGWYWTSTQDSRFSAFVQGFEDGGSDWYGKDSEFRVRAVRWIQLQPLNA